MRTRFDLAGVLVGALLAAPALAQTPASATAAPGVPEIVYRREAFGYDRGGRPDPFRSLLGTEELGVRVEDLSLQGVVFNPDPRRSMAVLVDGSANKRTRLRVGERIGGITVVGIYPRRVDLRVDEFGISRPETLFLKTRAKPTKQQPDSTQGSAQ